MPATRNSKTSRSSKLTVLAAAAALSLLSAAAVWFCWSGGYLLYYGDAEAHLNIARRMVDSRTPGWNQIGTVWLPLPHVLTALFAGRDDLWRSGLAGAIPSALFFVLGGVCLFLALRRALGQEAAAAAGVAAIALNPNVLYLQSLPMTEGIFFGCLCAMVYFAQRALRTGGAGWAGIAGLFSCAAALTRYDGWFVMPFVALAILLGVRKGRFGAAAAFSLLALAGPVLWLAHNAYYFGNALEFYNGPDSAKAIQGAAAYPGQQDWPLATAYFAEAAKLCCGAPLFWLSLAGVAAAAWRRAGLLLFLFALPPAFYIWSLHSGGTPIFVPSLKPFGYYNTRYGLAVMPLVALAIASLASFAPPRWRWAPALSILILAPVYWLAPMSAARIVTWKESQVNSEDRRAWTRDAARFLAANRRPGEGVITTFGDITGILRVSGVPLRDSLTWDNSVLWMAAVARPELFLHEEWALVRAADPVQRMLLRAPRRGVYYEREAMFVAGKSQVYEIYRRTHRIPNPAENIP